MACRWCDTEAGPVERTVGEGRSFRLALDRDGTPVLFARRHVILDELSDGEWLEFRAHLVSLRQVLPKVCATPDLATARLAGEHFHACFDDCPTDGSMSSVAAIQARLGSNLRPREDAAPYVPDRRVRPVATCVFLDGDRLLVVDNGDFLRPPAGEVEFGEHALEAVRREMAEEIGVRDASYQLIGVLENVFTDLGGPGHEVVFVFNGGLADLETSRPLRANEIHSGDRLGFWASVAELRRDPRPVYPGGLLDLVERHLSGN